MTITSSTEFNSLVTHALPFSEGDFSIPLLTWYQRNQAPHPWRLRWAQSRDPFPVWVSEIMLQQTVIAAVTPVFEKFCRTYPTLESFALATEDEVRTAVRGLGYYRRFALLHKACRELHQRADGGALTWPQGAKEWSNLPGIGAYTSAAIASITQNEPVPVVDGNVERVFARLFDVRLPINAKGWKETVRSLSGQLITKDHPGDYNQAVMELGQTVCRPIHPRCGACPVQHVCRAHRNASTSLAPGPKAAKPFVSVTLRLAVFRNPKTQEIGLVRRPVDSRFLGGTVGFYTQRLLDDGFCPEGSYGFGLDVQGLKEIGSIRHSITHHKISAKVVLAQNPPPGEVIWLPTDKVEEALISNLDRKAFFVLRKNFSAVKLLGSDLFHD